MISFPINATRRPLNKLRGSLGVVAWGRIECGMGWRAWIVELSSLRHPERHPHHHTDPRQSGSPPGEKGSILISKESCYCIDLHRKLIQRASARISRKRYYDGLPPMRYNYWSRKSTSTVSRETDHLHGVEHGGGCPPPSLLACSSACARRAPESGVEEWNALKAVLIHMCYVSQQCAGGDRWASSRVLLPE